MGGLIVTLSGVLGGGSSGALVIGLVLALVTVGGSYWFSDKLALRSAGAEVIGPDDHPYLYQMVANLAQRADLPMPTVAISPSPQPNAFATGRGPKKAVVCATQGLLAEMPRDEVEAVMAHELMHVKHRDILIGSVAAAIATAISFIANMAMWGAAFGGGGSDDDQPNPIALLATALLAPMAATLLQMAVSRSREFEADRGAAEESNRLPPAPRWTSLRNRHTPTFTTRCAQICAVAVAVQIWPSCSRHTRAPMTGWQRLSLIARCNQLRASVLLGFRRTTPSTAGARNVDEPHRSRKSTHRMGNAKESRR